MRPRVVGLTLAFALASTGCQAQKSGVPFIGCPADGQLGPIQAPKGQPRVVSLRDVPTEAIAYYKGEQAPGVFAPIGWHCRVWYGSSGSGVLVTPMPVDTAHFVPSKVLGPAVEMDVSFAGTSGRFSVARNASRLFPRVLATFIQGVKDEHLAPDSEFEPRQFARDSVRNADSRMAEFTTPPSASGLGTAGFLGPSQDPIHGLAVIALGEPDMTVLRVRLGADMRRIEAAVLRLNRECMQQTAGC